ncbi:hypothetical protein GCM10009733_054010 [Nonomuraea maheshkhaliensis]|uniref:Uncharacterized protein n=2 Tax=Nonomuraea maheshkhaliensis TaxID=419590 RepID=A0ABP4RFG3_9ACTN
MYGPPPPDHQRVPEYPRATSSPPIIVLVSGLAALLGFLLGVLVGFGAQTTSAEEPAPRVTVTVEESPTGAPETAATPPQDPQSTPGQTLPGQTPPGQTPPGQTQPGQTQPGQTQPGQTQPGQTSPATPPGQATPPGSGNATTPALNGATLRTLVVGTDIQPGTYRTTGPTAGFPLCYWARLKSTTGDVIASGMPTGPASVTILPTDKAFQTGGCVEWSKA